MRPQGARGLAVPRGRGRRDRTNGMRQIRLETSFSSYSVH